MSDWRNRYMDLWLNRTTKSIVISREEQVGRLLHHYCGDVAKVRVYVKNRILRDTKIWFYEDMYWEDVMDILNRNFTKQVIEELVNDQCY
jgi:hypothetical protein